MDIKYYEYIVIKYRFIYLNYLIFLYLNFFLCVFIFVFLKLIKSKIKINLVNVKFYI